MTRECSSDYVILSEAKNLNHIILKTESITSATNPKIKNLLLLQEKSKARREQGLFVVEGRRELEHCLASGYTLRSLFVCPDLLLSYQIPAGVSQVFEIPEHLYRKVAYREGTEGIIAVLESKSHRLEDLPLPENPLIVVLESVEKPGNLGAVLRSADAAGAAAVIICDPLTDLYNPNLIRASIGALFTVPVAVETSARTIDFLKERGAKILTAQLQDSVPYYHCDMKGATAIVMGTESTGLSALWREAADAHIRIPMLGRLDSLNVSVSAAILMYEAVRQRQ